MTELSFVISCSSLSSPLFLGYKGKLQWYYQNLNSLNILESLLSIIFLMSYAHCGFNLNHMSIAIKKLIYCSQDTSRDTMKSPLFWQFFGFENVIVADGKIKRAGLLSCGSLEISFTCHTKESIHLWWNWALDHDSCRCRIWCFFKSSALGTGYKIKKYLIIVALYKKTCILSVM